MKLVFPDEKKTIAEENMVSKRNKRKIVYEGTEYYWYVKINEHGHRVHIISVFYKENFKNAVIG